MGNGVKDGEIERYGVKEHWVYFIRDGMGWDGTEWRVGFFFPFGLLGSVPE